MVACTWNIGVHSKNIDDACFSFYAEIQIEVFVQGRHLRCASLLKHVFKPMTQPILDLWPGVNIEFQGVVNLETPAN